MGEVAVVYYYIDVDVSTLELMEELGQVLKISEITDWLYMTKYQ